MEKLRLDQITLDIEFLLISVIQGVALAALAGASVAPISNLQFEYFPYIATGFIFILVFWTGAINHALGFIEWPLDLVHSFLYFLASFIEVMALYQVTNPMGWFTFMLIFQVVAGVLYAYDLGMIKKSLSKNTQTSPKQKILASVYRQQSRELKVVIPGSLIFSLVALLFIYYLPELFINKNYHLLFLSLQGVIGLLFLINLLKNFNNRNKQMFKP